MSGSFTGSAAPGSPFAHLPPSRNPRPAPEPPPTLVPPANPDDLEPTPDLRRLGAAGEPCPLRPAIPGYEVLGELGRGGMGVVYKAWHYGLRRHVALKMILAGSFGGAEAALRLRSEAQAVARLQHPNVVQIYEIGEHQGLPFFSLEFVEGTTLARTLDGKPQPPAAAAALLETLARAMQHAHERGIVHRDLKPANVLLEANGAQSVGCGVPKIADFGIAKHLDGAAFTHTGLVLGTPAYMAPEQADGVPGAVGPPADLYALGTILYEMLTGRPPFNGVTPAETLRMVCQDDPIPPRRLQRDVPVDLETICLKCLEKDPARRYRSAALLADELRRFRAGEPVLARPVGRWERAAKWVRRRPAVAALSGAVVLVTVVALLLVTSFWRQAVDRATAEAAARGRADAKADDEKRAREAEAEARRNLEDQLAGAVLDRGIALCEKGEVRRGLLMMARSLKMATHDDSSPPLAAAIRGNLAGWSRHLLAEVAQLRHKHWAWGVACSPDGTLIATTSADHTARLWDARTGAAVGEPLQHERAVWAVAFSPDGKWLVTGSGPRADEGPGPGATRLWRLHGPNEPGPRCRPVGPPLPHTRVVKGVAFSPDGTRFLTWGLESSAALWDVAGPPRLRLRLPHQGPVWAAAFSPDGRTVLTASLDKTACLWDARTGARALPPLRHTGPVLAAAFSPDGTRLLTGGAMWDPAQPERREGEARLWTTATGAPLGEPLPHPGLVHAVAFSNDGRRFAIANAAPAGQGSARLWTFTPAPAARAPYRPLCEPLRHPEPVWTLAFSPNGRTLLTGCVDAYARLWDATDGHFLWQSGKHEGNIRAVAFSPDGSGVVTGSAGGNHSAAFRLWRVPFGPGREHCLRHADAVTGLAFDPAGRFVATAAGSAARLWHPADGGLLGELRPQPPGAIDALGLGPNGLLVLVSDWGREITFWDPLTRRQARAPLWSSQRVRVVAPGPEGKTLLAAGYMLAARLLDAKTGVPLRAVGQSRRDTRAVALSPDGKLLLTAGGIVDQGRSQGEADLWDTVSGQRLHRWEFEDTALCAAFSGDGALLAIGGMDRSVQLWRTATRSPFGPPLLQHRGPVHAVAFSPDGRLLLTGSEDRTAQLWDVRSGRPLGPPLGHLGAVTAVAFAPEGGRFATAARDGTANLLDLPPSLAGSPERVRLWVEVRTGMELDDEDRFRVLDAQAIEGRRRRLAELDAAAHERGHKRLACEP